MEITSVNLGDEYDEDLLARLRTALRRLEARAQDGFSGVIGSQDLSITEYLIGDVTVRVEIETYIGVTITGEAETVEKVLSLIEITPSSSPAPQP